MKDNLYEESANSARSKSEAKLYMAFHVVSIIFFVLAVLHAFFSIEYVPNVVASNSGADLFILLFFWFGLLVIALLLSFLFYIIKRRFNVSYDYSFVEDELRISKVFNGKKRKYLLTMKADQILKMGEVDSSAFERTVAGLSKKDVLYLTPNRVAVEGKTLYYIRYSSSIANTVYIIECREILMEYLVRAAGRAKWER